MKKALFVLFFLPIAAACGDSFIQRIPYGSVYIKIDLTTARDRSLAAMGSGVFYTTSNKLYQTERMGVSGVYVYHTLSDTYEAFDLCCPVECKKEAKVVRTGEGKLKCNTCGSVYDILYGGGYAVEGPANEHNYPLQHYTVRSVGVQELEVTN